MRYLLSSFLISAAVLSAVPTFTPPAKRRPPLFVKPAKKGMVYIPESVVSVEGKKVYVAPFYIEAREVSNVEYNAFLEKSGKKPLEGVEPDEPVTGICFEDARAFAESKGRRLPTDAEWEAAANYAERHTELKNFRGPAQDPSYPNVAEWTENEVEEESFAAIRRGEVEEKELSVTTYERAPMHKRDRCVSTGFRCAL